jgi:hypothetical protein
MTKARWAPGIGDPTIGGWITVIVYLIAFLFCLRIGLRAARRAPWEGGIVGGWCSLAALLFFLCINKQLDLQSLFTQVVRDHSLAHGWYADRHYYQIRFIAGLGLLCFVATLFIAASALRAKSFWTRIVALGTALLLGFIVLRAFSFHMVDQRLPATIYGLRYNWIAELTPLTLIILAAWRTGRRHKDQGEEKEPLLA